MEIETGDPYLVPWYGERKSEWYGLGTTSTSSECFLDVQLDTVIVCVRQAIQSQQCEGWESDGVKQGFEEHDSAQRQTILASDPVERMMARAQPCTPRAAKCVHRIKYVSSMVR